MKKRDMMIAALALALVAFCTLLAAQIKSARTSSDLTEDTEVTAETVSADTPAQPAPVQASAADAAAKNIFSAQRGVPPPPPAPETPPAAEQAAAPPPAPKAEEVNLNMLGNYPDDWPRYKLTGVSCVGGKYTAIIRGGPEHRVTSGDVFARNYTIGDDLSGGVTLHEVKIDERVALLRRGNDILTIKIGVEPPEVKKK